MPPKKKLRRDISGLKNQPKLTTDSSHTNEPMSSARLRTMIAAWQRILSKQDDFTNQISMLKSVIREAGHECIFLPKFHCELNPIEMVSPIFPH
jgi:hypothetical protein